MYLSGFFWTGKTLLYPVFYSVWNFIIFPVQVIRLVGNLLRALFSDVANGLENLCLVIHDTFQLLLVSGSPTLQSLQIVKSSAPSPSMWRTLWNDILSKVSAFGDLSICFRVPPWKVSVLRIRVSGKELALSKIQLIWSNVARMLSPAFPAAVPIRVTGDENSILDWPLCQRFPS